MRRLPILETVHLTIRPFALADAPAYRRLMEVCFGGAPESPESLAKAEETMRWAELNHRQLAALTQPPYGDRAIVLRESGAVIGSVGIVPCLDAFEQLPSFGEKQNAPFTPEVGLFWMIAPEQQGKGYATAAAQAVIEHLFQVERLKRIVATTDYDNLASQAVMRKLGMRLERNPFPEPRWLQVVGVLDNPDF